MIGERGVTLSGGQRQRLALARAFLTDPRILVLDDSTSAIDSATEDKIQRAIYAAAKGRTTFIITHRLSQIRWADLIIVMGKGKVAAIGTHEDLLAISEAYRRIFQRVMLNRFAITYRTTMGFFSGLDTEAYDRQYSDKELVRRIIQYFKPHSKRLAIVVIFLVLIAISGAAVPILVSRTVDSPQPGDGCPPDLDSERGGTVLRGVCLGRQLGQAAPAGPGHPGCDHGYPRRRPSERPPTTISPSTMNSPPGGSSPGSPPTPASSGRWSSWSPTW